MLFPRPAPTPTGTRPSAPALPRRALPLAGRLRHPRRARPARAPDPAPVATHTRDRLINRDVPQHVVQKILDHDSPQMTAHYARLSDKTVRDHWERARKVNAAGQPVQLSPDGPLGDAAWAKQQLSRATQALPNGYCQLPLRENLPACKLVPDLPDVRHDPGVPPAASRPAAGRPCRSSPPPRPPGTPASPR